jgi:hypothetical protein
LGGGTGRFSPCLLLGFLATLRNQEEARGGPIINSKPKAGANKNYKKNITVLHDIDQVFKFRMYLMDVRALK